MKPAELCGAHAGAGAGAVPMPVPRCWQWCWCWCWKQCHCHSRPHQLGLTQPVLLGMAIKHAFTELSTTSMWRAGLPGMVMKAAGAGAGAGASLASLSLAASTCLSVCALQKAVSWC